MRNVWRNVSNMKTDIKSLLGDLIWQECVTHHLQKSETNTFWNLGYVKCKHMQILQDDLEPNVKFAL